MAVTPLSTAQHSAVEALVAAHRLERVPVDERRCTAFLEQAEVGLADVPLVRHAQNKYNLAYDAAHDVGEAMLAAYGYRTASGPGQHEALGRFLAAVFDTPPENAASRHHDQMRRDGNRQRYNARPITVAAATAAGHAATLLFRAGSARAHPAS